MKYTKLTATLAASFIAAALPSCLDESGYNPAPNADYSTPNVQQLRNGNYLVSYAGKTASYNSNGIRMSDSGMSGFERSQAQQAVNTFRREQSGSDDHSGYQGHSGGGSGVPVVRPRSDGKLEVQMPAGGVVLYNENGGLIQKGSSVSNGDLVNANRAVRSYLREQ